MREMEHSWARMGMGNFGPAATCVPAGDFADNFPLPAAFPFLMKPILTPLLALALVPLLPTDAWSQETPAPERPRMREAPVNPPQVQRGEGWRIGVMVEEIDPLLRKHLNLPENSGLVVDEVVDGGPAAKAGISKGDLILSANGKPVANLEMLRRAVRESAESGRPLMLDILEDGKKRTVGLAPPERPRRDVRPTPPVPQPGADRPRVTPSPEGMERMANALREMREEIERQRRNNPAEGMERMGKALREMQGEIAKQREVIQRLEKKVAELERKRD